MDIAIHGRNVELTEAIRHHTGTRLEAAMSRHEHRIGRVDVRLADINGPRGGMDKACEVVVDLRRAGRLVVKEADDDLYIAVSRAAHRLRIILARELQRLRDRRRGFHHHYRPGEEVD